MEVSYVADIYEPLWGKKNVSYDGVKLKKHYRGPGGVPINGFSKVLSFRAKDRRM